MYIFEYFSLFEIAVMLFSIVLSYVIFGMIGFGTVLIASPILIIFLPLSQIIPLLALLDMFAAISNVLKDGKKADFTELKRLIPLMMIGICCGFFIIMNIEPKYALLAFGLFMIAYSCYSLSGFKPQSKLSKNAVFPLGFSGGLFGAMFGSGGFLYSIYLNGRIDSPEKIRITQTTLIGCSTVLRVILFGMAGVYFSEHLLTLALIFFPFMLLGSLIGRKITLSLTKQQFLRIINMIVLVSGISMILKFIFSHT